MRSNIVLHYVDGLIRKGATADFFPNKEMFHVIDVSKGGIIKVKPDDLKAVFFVKNFDGNPSYTDKNNVERIGIGKKIQVHFKDGEMLIGYTQGYSESRRGFFVLPCDPNSNNEKVYVVSAATNRINFV